MRENTTHKISNLRKVKFRIKKIIHFFTIKIWVVSAEVGLSTFKKGWYKVSRILSVTIKKFGENNCGPRASDLTYFTLFAIVPFIAIAYGVAMLFGMETHLNDKIHSALGGQGMLSENLIEFAQKTISQTKGGLVTAVASVVFLWSIFRVLGHVENTMNKIWDVNKKRKIGWRVLEFLLFITFGPILLLAGSAVNIFISANVIDAIPQEYEIIQNTLSLLTSFLVPIALFSLLFFMIYQGMPNRTIKPRSSFFAAVITGILFQLLQFYYFDIQMSISSYNSIYGSFAALPLLLIWLRLSWMIILFGAELAYGIEQEREFIASQQPHQPSRNP
jgi:membrane protein